MQPYVRLLCNPDNNREVQVPYDRKYRIRSRIPNIRRRNRTATDSTRLDILRNRHIRRATSCRVDNPSLRYKRVAVAAAALRISRRFPLRHTARNGIPPQHLQIPRHSIAAYQRRRIGTYAPARNKSRNVRTDITHPQRSSRHTPQD